MAQLILKLIMAHAVTDWALQTEFIARTKNRNIVPEYLDKDHLPMWPYTLTMHALINAAGVYYITNSWECTLAEIVGHWIIDYGKCEKRFNLHLDQLYHLLFKLLYSLSIYSQI